MVRNRTEENRRYRLRNPEKVRIRNIVTHAIEDGLLPHANTKDCVGCGGRAARWDHYRGYSQRYALTVEPVCVKCCTAREMRRGTYVRHSSAKGNLGRKVS
jgi:hypothetical protein